MASINKSTHEREAQFIEGYIAIEDENIWCIFGYNREGNYVKIISAFHGDVDLCKIFTFSAEMFGNVEQLIEDLISVENLEYDYEEQPSHGSQESVTR